MGFFPIVSGDHTKLVVVDWTFRCGIHFFVFLFALHLDSLRTKLASAGGWSRLNSDASFEMPRYSSEAALLRMFFTYPVK
jgi:hypothetical protein